MIACLDKLENHGGAGDWRMKQINNIWNCVLKTSDTMTHTHDNVRKVTWCIHTSLVIVGIGYYDVKLRCSSSMGMKNIWRNMMERPTTTRPVLFPSVGCWDICICCCEGYRWRQMGLNIIDMLLCGRAVSDTGAWERGPTIQYLLPQIKMTQHPISILFY